MAPSPRILSELVSSWTFLITWAGELADLCLRHEGTGGAEDDGLEQIFSAPRPHHTVSKFMACLARVRSISARSASFDRLVSNFKKMPTAMSSAREAHVR